MHPTEDNAREVTLHNGVRMPTLAFGCAFGDWVGRSTFQGFLPEQAWRAITLALDNGFRAFDGARVYGTERILGNLLGQRFASGELTRNELFITTKLAHPMAPPHINISHRRTWDADQVADIAQKVRDDMVDTLDDLGLGYVDLLLMHWPGVFELPAGTAPDFPRQARATIWRTFCELADKGAARGHRRLEFHHRPFAPTHGGRARAGAPSHGESGSRSIPIAATLSLKRFAGSRALSCRRMHPSPAEPSICCTIRNSWQSPKDMTNPQARWFCAGMCKAVARPCPRPARRSAWRRIATSMTLHSAMKRCAASMLSVSARCAAPVPIHRRLSDSVLLS